MFVLIFVCLFFLFQGPVSSLGRAYDVVSCTKLAVFDSSLALLSNVSILVTSVLSNFLCGACDAVDPDQLVEAANATLSAHVLSLVAYMGTHPQTRVAIVPPLPRLTPGWFNSYLPCFTSFLLGEVSRHQNPQLQVLAPFVALPHSFESDGVHLKPEAGENFIRYVITGVDQIFPVSASPSSFPSDSFGTVTTGAPSFASATSNSRYVTLKKMLEKLHYSYYPFTALFACWL